MTSRCAGKPVGIAFAGGSVTLGCCAECGHFPEPLSYVPRLIRWVNGTFGQNGSVAHRFHNGAYPVPSTYMSPCIEAVVRFPFLGICLYPLIAWFVCLLRCSGFRSCLLCRSA